ncbi:MAG: phosphate transport system substrate-binding protein [Candidatus Peregrinibacteria bacterium Greene0416_19]|nr:MAG: phosphate transport system substrate-binding protein [Candidatus Peregrinibacteria bacterium Greene0416_19]
MVHSFPTSLMMKDLRLLVPVCVIGLSACSAATGTLKTDTVVIQGSDTEVQLVSALAEAFGARNPGASISVAGGGSAVGIAALINGETDIANSSRAMKPAEIATAKEKGRDPQEFILARDGLSVIVHPSNGLATLTLDHISKMFSGKVTNWKGVGGPDAPIVLYGRQSTSGTFGYFRDAVVKDDYAVSLRQMEGSQAIVDAVAADAHGVGYVGVGYVRGADGRARSDIKALTVSRDGASEAVSPLDMEAVRADRYPIARRIYQYLPAVPAKDSIVEQFLRFEASAEGQAVIGTSGFYPLTANDEAMNQAFFSTIR